MLCIALFHGGFESHIDERSLIQKIMLYELKIGHSTAKAIRNICWAKSKSVIDHSLGTRWLKKFRYGCKDVDNQAKSARQKAVDSEALLDAIEVKPATSTRISSGELGISKSKVFRQQHPEIPNCASRTTKIMQNFWFTLIHWTNFVL